MPYPWSAGQILTAADLNAAIASAGHGTRQWIAKTSATDQTGIAAVADITGLSVTWTADSTRTYKFTINVVFAKITAANFASLHLTDGSNTIKVSRSEWMQINDYATVTLVWTETGLSGSQTRKARADCTSGTLNIVNSFARNGILVVEDMGAT